jgi:putative hemolysin
VQKQSDANGEPLGSPLRFIPTTRTYAVSRIALKFRILASSGQARDSSAFVQKGSAMKEKAFKGADLAGLCQGVSPDDEPCGNPATFHCLKCGRRFCGSHAEDDEWHQCVLPSGEESGEA